MPSRVLLGLGLGLGLGIAAAAVGLLPWLVAGTVLPPQDLASGDAVPRVGSVAVSTVLSTAGSRVLLRDRVGARPPRSARPAR